MREEILLGRSERGRLHQQFLSAGREQEIKGLYVSHVAYRQISAKRPWCHPR
jgi:hypothetical protein